MLIPASPFLISTQYERRSDPQERGSRNQHSDFQLNRSRRLLRVRSSDWYQNEATFLYFHVETQVLNEKQQLFCNFGIHVWVATKNTTSTSRPGQNMLDFDQKYEKYEHFPERICDKQLEVGPVQFWWESIRFCYSSPRAKKSTGFT